MLKQIKQDLDAINAFGKNPPGLGITRLAYSPEDLAARKLVAQYMVDEGLEVSTDFYGNIFGIRPGLENEPLVLMGSHLDTVPEGGRYDGTAGIVAALAAVRQINKENISTRYPVGIVIFAAEESSRFGQSLLGSRGFTGNLTTKQIESITDLKGKSLKKILEREQDCLRRKYRPYKPTPLKLYLELHIEQGPILERNNKKLGLVQKIAAPSRMSVTFQGCASHSGATPMGLRKDALVTGAHVIIAVERICHNYSQLLKDGTLVGTVGDVKVTPGAMNVVPGKVELLIDIRSTDMDTKSKAVAEIQDYVKDLALERRLDYNIEILEDQEPIALNNEIIATLADICDEMAIPYQRMYSGAGHDAMQVATKYDSALLFIPCGGGLSHNPRETAEARDIALGASVLQKALCHYAEIL